RSSSRLNSETPIAKAVGVLFCLRESFAIPANATFASAAVGKILLKSPRSFWYGAARFLTD
ncbi:hypothetical protein, partial [Pseudomonas sp. SWRI81]|uniref:hypothetical protein n=1 Tax=Pseudomonas sp. SWRI81 TaxID=2745505 RepID=UPI001EE20D9C